MKATMKAWGICLMGAGFAACGVTGRDDVQVTTSALVVNQANVFGFEDRTQWSSSATLSSSSNHTQGAASLGVAAHGYTAVTSAVLPSLTGVTALARVDLLLPTAQANPFWYGTAELYISVPSKGVNNLDLGLVELTGKALNQFVSLDYALPASLVATLQAGGYSDFTAKVVLNVPSNETGTYLLDNLRFVSVQSGGCGDFVEGANFLSNWTSGGDSQTTTLSALSSGAVRGSQALRAVTNAPFDWFVRYNAPSPINASTANELRVAVRALNTTPSGWQEAGPILVVEDTNGARITFSPHKQYLGLDGVTWNVASAPIAGGPSWDTTGGPINWSSVRAVEIHADTFDAGFTVDVDALSFERTGTTCDCASSCGAHGVCNQDHLYCDCNIGWGGNATCSSCAAGFALQNNACVLQNDGTSTVWPNAFSKAASDPWLAVHHDELQTVKPNVLALGFVNLSNPTQDTALVNTIFAGFREGSRMQGFKNPSQASQIQYQLAKYVDLRDGVNGRPQPPAGYPYQNSTLYPASAADRAAGATADYAQFFNQTFANLYAFPDPNNPSHNLTLCELADRGIVHEVWVLGSGDVTDAGFAEVLESKQKYSAFGSKLAGSFNRCAGNGCFRADVPVCGRSIRIGFVNYNRGPGCYMHSLGHGMESAMGQDIFTPMQKWFLPFAAFNLDTKYGLPFTSTYGPNCASGSCISYPTPTHGVFQFDGATYNVDPFDTVCGNVHFPPNGVANYDYFGPAQVRSSCTGFGRHGGSGGADANELIGGSVALPWSVAPYTQFNDCGGEFLTWWYQNMPMFGSGQTFTDGTKMKSAWPYLYY